MLTSWWKQLQRKIDARRTRHGASTRPERTRRTLRAEALEDRLAPAATLWVDSTPGMAGTEFTSTGSQPVSVPGLTPGVTIFSALASALAAANDGDTINISDGTYVHSGQLNISKQVSIVGAGQDVTILQRAGQATGTEDRAFEIQVPYVTFAQMTLGGWQTAPSVANLGNGYLVWNIADHTTFDDVRFDANDNRVAIYTGTQDYLTVNNSRFTGTLFRAGIRGAGEHMNISYNSFEESHYWYSPIYFEYGGATSGTISYNYFANRVGVANDALGDFKDDGTGLYAITNFQPHTTTGDGLYIVYNTFDFQDSGLVNGSGNSPIPTGVYIDPLLSPSGPIVIQDNIFRGYKYTGPQPSTSPLWRPGQGVFGGALEFDGIDDFGVFQSPLFDVGTRGTLNFWVKMDNVSKRNQFFEGPGDAGFEVQFRTNSGGQFYGRATTVGGDFVIRSGPDGAAALNTWKNVQVIWDHAGLPAADLGGTLRIYIDGVESSYLTNSTPTDLNWGSVVSTINGLMNVGRDPGDGTRYFDGMMDDIGWFNNVLTAAERSAIRTSGVTTLAADSRLVAHWDLDSTTGDTEADNKNGILLYLSSNGSLPANLFGPQFVTGGQFGGALDFDGFDDYATFDFGANELGDKGTLNFWVQMDNVSRRNQFFEGPGNGGFEVQYRTNSSGQFYARTTTDGGDVVIRSGGDSAALGVWTNIQVIWDFAGLPAGDSGGALRIYRDGVESTYVSGFTPTDLTWPSIITTVNGIMSVGRDPGDATRFFDGRMDDIAWFNDVLPAADRATLRTSSGSAFASDSRMVAYWSLDDSVGTTIVPGDGGTSISLHLQAPPPPPPRVGYAINAGPTVVVDNNLFWDNQVNYNAAVTVGPNGNYIGDPLFKGMGTTTEEIYSLYFGSPAAFNGTGFPTSGKRHIGAYQGIPLLPAAVVYVNEDWASLANNTFLPDVEPSTPGNQPVYIGTNGYADIAGAMTAVQSGGTIVVFGNGAAGPHSSNYTGFTVDKSVTFRLLADPAYSESTVTLDGAVSLSSQNLTIVLDHGHGNINLTTTSTNTIDATGGTPSVSITTLTTNTGAVQLDGVIGGTTPVSTLTVGTGSNKVASLTVHDARSAGAVNLAVSGSITESGSDATADLVGTAFSITSGAIGSVGNRLEIDATTLQFNASGFNVYLEDTAGGLQVNNSTVGASNTIDLLVTGGNLTSVVDGTRDLGAQTLILSVPGGTIGTGTGSRLEINVVDGGLGGLTATTGGGGIYLRQVSATPPSTLAVANVNAGSGAVDILVSDGNLTSAAGDPGTADIVGGAVTLRLGTAGRNIGVSAANRLEIDATVLQVVTNTAAVNNAYLVDTAGGLQVTDSSVGGIPGATFDLLVQNGNLTSVVDGTRDIAGDLVVVEVIGAASTIGVSAANPLEVNALTRFDAKTAGGNLFAKDTSGDFPIGLVDVGAGTADLRSAVGSITDANGASKNVEAGSLFAKTIAGSVNLDLSVNNVQALASTTISLDTDQNVNVVQTFDGTAEGLDSSSNGTVTLGKFGAGGAFVLTSANGISDGSAVVLATDLTLTGGNETIGSLTGGATETVNLGSYTLTTGGNNGSTTFAGAIHGTGGLTKAGSGTFTLSNTSPTGLDYTGATAVNAGTLNLTGELYGTGLDVTLAGTGTALTGGGTGKLIDRGVVADATGTSVSGMAQITNVGGVGVTVNPGDSVSLTANRIENNVTGIHVNGGAVTFVSGNVVLGGADGLVVDGALADVVPPTVADTVFAGQSDQYIELVNNALAGPRVLNATSAKFGATEGTAIDGATMTPAQLTALELKLRHYPDDNGVGLIIVRSNYVTTDNGNLLIIGSDAVNNVSVNTNVPTDVKVSLNGLMVPNPDDPLGKWDVSGAGKRVIVFALGGNDFVQVTGNVLSELRGGLGNDSLYGGNNTDVLYGDEGNDTLVGGNGHDVLVGGWGRDNLQGGAGNDVLIGGAINPTTNYNRYDYLSTTGLTAATSLAELSAIAAAVLDGNTINDYDTLSGGLGADGFIAHYTGSGIRDLITDFNAAHPDIRVNVVA